MEFSFADLDWLPAPPEDFRQRCKAALPNAPDLASTLRALGAYRLGNPELLRLSKTLRRLRGDPGTIPGLAPFRLAILGNATFSLTVPAIEATALRYGIAIEITEPPFDQVVQFALDPGSDLYKEPPDAVLLALDHRGLGLTQSLTGSDADAAARVSAAADHVTMLSDAIHEHASATVILQTVPSPFEAVFGSLEQLVPGTERAMIDALNARLRETARTRNDVLLDIANLAA